MEDTVTVVRFSQIPPSCAATRLGIGGAKN
jgi:hypothetical protein